MPRVVPAGVLPRAALRYLRTKRRRPSQHWTDVWREEHAVAFTVAQMTEDALLAETHQALLKALRKGETMETFRSGLQPWLERRGWAPKGRGGDIPTRLHRIYNTNLRTARASGQWDRISRNADLLPYLVYELGPSEQHRVEHAAWSGLCLLVDDPWWNTHYPPNGWGCKCRVRQVTRPPKGSSTTAPETRLRNWTNPATGEVRRVAVGIDPGWDYHIGAQRSLGVNAAWLRRCERAVDVRGAAAATRMVERHVAGPGFRWFVERPRAKKPPRWEARPDLVEATPVGVLPVDTAAALGATNRIVRLTERVMHKLAAADLPRELYSRLPEILRAKPRKLRSKTGQRWEFGVEIEVKGERRRARVVVEVSGGLPVLRSMTAAARRTRKASGVEGLGFANRDTAKQWLASRKAALEADEDDTWRRWRKGGRQEGYDAVSLRLQRRHREAATEFHERLFAGRKPGPVNLDASQLPEDMQASADEAARFVGRLIGEENATGRMKMIVNPEVARQNLGGWARIRPGEISLRPSAPSSTMIHEMMHVVEGRTERHLRASVDWYDRHTAGEALVRDDGLYGSGVGRRDDLTGYDAKYAGTQPYGAGRLGDDAAATVMSKQDGMVGSTEVMTRAADMLFGDPFKLAELDPHLFDFIYDHFLR